MTAILNNFAGRNIEKSLSLDKFKKNLVYFQLNLDEECIVGSDEFVKVIVSTFCKDRNVKEYEPKNAVKKKIF